MKSGKRPKRLRRGTNSAILLLAGGGIAMGIAALVIALEPRRVESKGASEPVQITGDFDTVLIPTPTRTIARGEKLGDVPFSKVKWPKNKFSDDYISDIESYRDAIALAPIPKYLPVPTSSVTYEAVDKNAVVEGIPEGMRAITVRVDEESAVEGWARSGNFVDVILIRAAPDNFTGFEAKVIAEKVKILSVEGSAAAGSGGPGAQKAARTVTLLTSQEEALKVKTASSIGKLTFALRGSGDETPTVTTAMDQRRLLGTTQPGRDKKTFRGFAKGPDGKVYVLTGETDRWMPTPEVPSEAPESFFQAPRAKLTEKTEAEKRVEDTADEKEKSEEKTDPSAPTVSPPAANPNQ